ncbi:MAG: YfcE family phosphodiesterase [Firmicutes bacterium]|nr:YfcE family phosphodiesterase [Bacillota bacterium]
MTRIGVLSDTHMHTGERLPPAIARALAGVDLILHAGDLTALDLLRQLQDIAPVRAVAGNACSWEVKEALPSATSFQVERLTILLTHGAMSHLPVLQHRALRQMARQQGAQLVVCGHTHRPAFVRAGSAPAGSVHQDVAILNPGQARPLVGPRATVALLTVDGTHFAARIVDV